MYTIPYDTLVIFYMKMFAYETFGIKPRGHQRDTDETKKFIRRIPQMLADGIARRGNVLGGFILNDILFNTYTDGSETYRGIGLGCPYNVHLKHRPFLDTLYGDGTYGIEWKDSNPSGNWTYEMLKTETSNYIAKYPNITDTIIDIWGIMLLHKVSFGTDMSYDDANEFCEFRVDFLKFSILPQAPYPECMFSEILEKKMKYINRFIELLPDEMSGEDKRTNANTILELMVFAGGISVPRMVRVILSHWALGELDDFDMSAEHDRKLVTMEALRRNPPVTELCPINVSGEYTFPDGINSMTHTAFDDPLMFKRRDDIDKYKREMISFADQALPIEGFPGSARVCPAKSLAFHMILAFIESVDFSNCKVISTPVSDIMSGYINVNLKIKK
jgi:hypothetical protein